MGYKEAALPAHPVLKEMNVFYMGLLGLETYYNMATLASQTRLFLELTRLESCVEPE